MFSVSTTTENWFFICDCGNIFVRSDLLILNTEAIILLKYIIGINKVVKKLVTAGDVCLIFKVKRLDKMYK